MKKFKFGTNSVKLISIILLLTNLYGCSSSGGGSGSSTGNNTNKNNSTDTEKLSEIKKTDRLVINNSKKNEDSLLEQEIAAREQGYESLNNTKDYLVDKKKELDDNLKKFINYIDVTRELMIVDLKMIISVKKSILEEKDINSSNYFYQLFKQMSVDEKKQFLLNSEDLLDKLDEKNVFNKNYYIYLDSNNIGLANTDSDIIHNYVNYYLYKSKYKKSIISNINDINKGLDILKIDNVELKSLISAKGIKKLTFFKENLNILNTLLSK